LAVSGKPFRAGGYAGEWLARLLSEYLNRTGSVVAVCTLTVLSIIMSTQFSFGRFFGAIIAATAGSATRAFSAFGDWREERRRERQRREVIAKHTKKGAVVEPKGATETGATGVLGDTAVVRAARKREAVEETEPAAYANPKSFA